MSTGSPKPNHDALMDQLWDYLQGELASEHTESFEAALRDSPEAIQAGVDLIEVMVMTRELCQREGEARKELFLGTSPEHRLDDVISAVADPHRHAAETTLAELCRMEAATQTGPAVLTRPKKQVAVKETGALSAHDYAAAGSYVLQLALISKPAKKLYAYAAIAAVLLLAFALFNPFANNETPTDAPLASDNSNKPAESAPPILRDQTVATLTAEHDAVWDRQPDNDLYAGQRLTLTAGFAEITTHNGAIAILEAPSTIELLDNDNAIRLESGKLVGICETPSSKGFTAYTPSSAIRDIGTRFGVRHDMGITQISVIKGEVSVSTLSDTQRKSVALVTGQHAQVTEAGGIARLDQPETMFVEDWSALVNPIQLTGQAQFERVMPPSLIPGVLEGDLPIVFAERSGVRLPAGFEVTMASPGDYVHDKLIEPVALAQETIADCYFIHFDVPGQPQAPVTRTATLHFDRPIVGVITLPDHLLASEKILKRPDVAYRHAVVPEGAPAVEGLDYSDRVWISQDRYTLEFELATGPFTDQFRVLVQAQPEAAR